VGFFAKRRKKAVPAPAPAPAAAFDVVAQQVRFEVERYFAAESVELFKDDGNLTDIIEWWKRNKGTYPHVAAVACSTLAMQGSNCPSERIWNAAGDVVSIRRTRQTDESVDDQLVISQNSAMMKDLGVFERIMQVAGLACTR